jgi:hypothetical protein
LPRSRPSIASQLRHTRATIRTGLGTIRGQREEAVQAVKTALKRIGWYPLLGFVALTVTGIVQFPAGQWILGCSLLVVALLVVAAMLHTLSLPPGRDPGLSWENSTEQSTPERPKLDDFDHNRPLISIATQGNNEGRYVCVSWDDENATWSLIVSPEVEDGRNPETSATPDKDLHNLTDDEYQDYVTKWGLQFLAQDAYSDEAWLKCFY